MKKVIVSRPLKNISTSGGYLVVELDSGVMTIIEKPRYIGLHTQPGILDSSDIAVLVGTLFFLLVIGVFLDYFDKLSLVAWYGVMMFSAGLLLIVLLIAPRSVLVIEAGDKTYYFTRLQGVDERTIKEIVTRIHFSVQTASDKATVDNSSKVS
jgi:hypothetical protein